MLPINKFKNSNFVQRLPLLQHTHVATSWMSFTSYGTANHGYGCHSAQLFSSLPTATCYFYHKSPDSSIHHFRGLDALVGLSMTKSHDRTWCLWTLKNMGMLYPSIVLWRYVWKLGIWISTVSFMTRNQTSLAIKLCHFTVHT